MARRKPKHPMADDPQWHKDAIIYQTHVRAFYDSQGDGIGDFRGMARKLDYIEDLGVTAIWLLPFYVSPLKDDGYDIADYVSVHPSYGTLADFKSFLDEAHRRGIRVITELVLNHTSDQHKWFQRARNAPPGSRYRDWYVWSDTTDRYSDARIIFQDFEPANWSWDRQAGAYFWHRFYSHQPDLNFDNPAVRRALTRVLDTWFEMGIDGLRLDAIPYLYQREGTSCENLPETHQFLKDLRAHTDRLYPNRVFLAEANQWPEDAAAYFGEGDECHMAFHFPLMPRLFMAVRREERHPIVDILEQMPVVPDNCQWALFLRNHDELTLEMVTDAERDYMYRTYGSDPRWRVNLGIRRRLAPLLENSRRRIELLTSLLFSLPGSPILYYGDEIGMGDNVYLGDRNGVRTPMQWTCDRNAGFSSADPQSLYLPVITTPEYHFETINVETQQSNPQSLLWWNKRLIALRKQHKVFGRGALEFLHPQNPRVLAFFRRDESETLLIVANLSRFVQAVELDLSAFQGWAPMELFGLGHLPPISSAPYLLTLGPHAFYWFRLEPPSVQEIETTEAQIQVPRLHVRRAWKELLTQEPPSQIEGVLPDYFLRQRWFGGKNRKIRSTRIIDSIGVPTGKSEAVVALIEVTYTEGDPETYQIALACMGGDEAAIFEHESDAPILAMVEYADTGEHALIFDALWDPGLSIALIEGMARQRRLKGMQGVAIHRGTRALREAVKRFENALEPVLPKAEQSNSSVILRDPEGQGVFILKLFRKLEPGVNPELELVRFLTQKTKFENVPRYAGAIEYQASRKGVMTLAVLQDFVPNEGDAWEYTCRTIRDYFDRAAVRSEEIRGGLLKDIAPDALAVDTPNEVAVELIGEYLEMARLLGQRTGQMHAALASDTASAEMAPERFLHFHRHALCHEVNGRIRAGMRRLRESGDLPEPVQGLARDVLAYAGQIAGRLKPLRESRISAKRIRIHGDYHLGQVLYTGKDMIIIDFEGEPAAPISQRRIKHSPLRDVAGMLRSFHYASQYSLVGDVSDPLVRAEDRVVLEEAATFWYRWVCACFMSGYLSAVAATDLLPKTEQELTILLDAYLFDKAGYELAYELKYRPAWSAIPLRGLLQLFEDRNGKA